MFLSDIDASLPLFLPPFPSLSKCDKNVWNWTEVVVPNIVNGLNATELFTLQIVRFMSCQFQFGKKKGTFGKFGLGM